MSTTVTTTQTQLDAAIANGVPSYSCDRCGDMGYYSESGSWSADDDVPCTECRAIGYESSPYGPDGDWGPES